MPIQDGCISKNRWKNKFIVPLSSFCLLAFFFTCGTMWSECLKTCSPSRDLLVVRSLFFFVRKNHEFQIHLDHLTSFFLCCCKCLLLFRFYIKTSSTSSSSHKTAVLHLSLLFKRTTVPPRVFIRPYIRNPIFRAGSHTHTHTRTRKRDIKMAFGFYCLLCVRVCRTRHQRIQKLLATARLAGRRI